MLGMLAHQRAAEFERVLAGRTRAFLDEAFHVDGVLVGVDAAPRADRNMRVAHHVLDQQVRHRVAELRVARLRPPALHLAAVLAVDDAGRVRPRIDRLAGRLHMQADQFAFLVEAGRHLADRDRAVEIVRLIFLAAPDQLDWRAGEFLRDGHGLTQVVLPARAAAETAAEVVAMDVALRERCAGFLGERRQVHLRDSASRPTPRPCRARASRSRSSSPCRHGRGTAWSRSPRSSSRRPRSPRARHPPGVRRCSRRRSVRPRDVSRWSRWRPCRCRPRPR